MSSSIYFRSHDEVNIALARSWCDQHDQAFQLADARDELFPHNAIAIAIDLDYLGLGPTERGRFVQRLCSALLPYPLAVASYDLDRDLTSTLAARGVLVFRKTGGQLFQALAKAGRYGGACSSGEYAA